MLQYPVLFLFFNKVIPQSLQIIYSFGLDSLFEIRCFISSLIILELAQVRLQNFL